MIINLRFTNFKPAMEYIVNELSFKCKNKNEYNNVLSRDLRIFAFF